MADIGLFDRAIGAATRESIRGARLVKDLLVDPVTDLIGGGDSNGDLFEDAVPLIDADEISRPGALEGLLGAMVGSSKGVENAVVAARDAGVTATKILNWVTVNARHEQESSIAALTGLARNNDFKQLLNWAARGDGADTITTVTAPDEKIESVFTVPERVYLLGRAIELLVVQDRPMLAETLAKSQPFSESGMFDPAVVEAVSSHQELVGALSGAGDEHYENVILPMSRIPGVNVIVLAALLVQEVLDPMEVLRWVGADINKLPRTPIANRPEDLERLPKPGTPGPDGKPARYIIFSDAHRESQQDVEFRIDHFNRNQEMYLRALDWCDDGGYTVIENGDCEELWYVPSFDPAVRQKPLDRLKSIVELHEPVYTKLQAMAKSGRYFRSMGNHDSYLWEDPALLAFRQKNNFPTLHGGFIIPDCKSMDDFFPHIGLDTDSYSNRCDSLIIHGHHFDFWNCDEHNRLGKFITNAVAVPADAFDDLIYDYRGIDRMGNPMVEFWDVIAEITPWNSWPPADVSRKWAQALEQRSTGAGVTQDSIVYSETFAAIMTYLMHSDPWSIERLGINLCIGHTHNPHSRPVTPLVALKTRYLNSGTTGWWEHIIWAIEISEDGVPRLIYWSEEDAHPVTMDWELNDEEGSTPALSLRPFIKFFERYLGSEPANAISLAIKGSNASLDGATASSAAAATAAAPGEAAVASAAKAVAGSAIKLDGGAAANGDSPFLELIAQQNPTLEQLTDLLAPSQRSLKRFGLTTDIAGLLNDPTALAALASSSRGTPELRGADPRSWPAKLLAAGAMRKPSEPPAADVARWLFPLLALGARSPE